MRTDFFECSKSSCLIASFSVCETVQLSMSQTVMSAFSESRSFVRSTLCRQTASIKIVRRFHGSSSMSPPKATKIATASALLAICNGVRLKNSSYIKVVHSVTHLFHFLLSTDAFLKQRNSINSKLLFSQALCNAVPLRKWQTHENNHESNKRRITNRVESSASTFAPYSRSRQAISTNPKRLAM
jgi:hypothetical protein